MAPQNYCLVAGRVGVRVAVPGITGEWDGAFAAFVETVAIFMHRFDLPGMESNLYIALFPPQ